MPYPMVPTIADPHTTPTHISLFSKNKGFVRENLHGALRSNCFNSMATINRLLAFANALSMPNASVAGPCIPSKQGYGTEPSFTFAGLRIPAYGLFSLTIAGLQIVLILPLPITRHCYQSVSAESFCECEPCFPVVYW